MNGKVALFSGTEPPLWKPRLLLVEDEPSFSSFLYDLLVEEYEVEVVSNGEAAWMVVERRLPDLILSDVEMPLLDGLGLLRRLRADDRSASVPLVLMTAGHQRELLFAGLEAGMDEFLPKPFHPLELLARLRCQRRMVVLRREATELIAREKAEAVAQAKNRFFAALSHELRTPLTPVQFAAYLLGQTKGLPASVYENAEVIRRNVEIESQLINDLLDLSQIVGGKLEVSRSSIDLHDCLGQAIRECREDYLPKSLHLTVDLTAPRHEVTGDANRLRQVFCHLLRNAGKFTPEHGSVTVRSANDGEDIVVEVQDSGIGIATECLPRIFEPFDQSTSAKRPPDCGLGISLALAHAIVTAHEGQITAQSPGLGKGATFRVCLNTQKVPGPLRVLGD